MAGGACANEEEAFKRERPFPSARPCLGGGVEDRTR